MAARAKINRATRKTTSGKSTKVKLKEVAKVEEASTKSISGLKYLALFLVILGIALILFKYRGILVAATVNGEPVLRFTVIKELEKQGGNQALEALVAEKLVYQEAKKQNINVDDNEINDQIKRMEEAISGQGQNLDTLLSAQGLTRDDLTRRIKAQLLSEKLLGDKLMVKPEEIDEYVKNNQGTFDQSLSQEEIKKQVEEYLKQSKFNTEFNPWLDGLKTSAKIQYLVNY